MESKNQTDDRKHRLKIAELIQNCKSLTVQESGLQSLIKSKISLLESAKGDIEKLKEINTISKCETDRFREENVYLTDELYSEKAKVSEL